MADNATFEGISIFKIHSYVEIVKTFSSRLL